MELKILALVLLGPLAAAYDFVTNPAAPPQIFEAQFIEGFGHPPGANLPQPKRPLIKRRVYLTRS